LCKILQSDKPAEIKIISAVERVLPMAAEPFAISDDYYLRVEQDLRGQAKEAVSEAEKIIRDKLSGADLSIQTEVLTGSVKQIIVDEAREFDADLIVVGSHGYGFFGRVLLGSVSDFVAHHAPCSVLIARTRENSS
jgi:nucleotide-binding universal stress UspA family protein